MRIMALHASMKSIVCLGLTSALWIVRISAGTVPQEDAKPAAPAVPEAAAATGAKPSPNVVIFFLDDFGWADWQQNGAATGSDFYETPNMNRLASEGLYFTSGYAPSPLCSPTRGALLCGQSPALNKLTDWISGSGDKGKPIREAVWTKKLPVSVPTFARSLSQAGYRSIILGKWHLGEGGEPASDPLRHGFDVNIGGSTYGHPPGPEGYFASNAGFSKLPNLGPDVAPAGSYLTDVLSQRAVAEIRNAAAERTAFVMYMAHYAVHTPLQAPAATIAKYQAKLADNPGKDWRGQTNPTYAAMIEHVDRALGDLLAALDDPDGDPATHDSIADNTLVVFSSDNGGLLGSTSNRPLRDGKGGNYEGGVRVPWIFRWPGKIAPGTSAVPVISYDLFPTLLALTGVAPPADHIMTGRDLSPLLAGRPFERPEPLIFHYPHWSPADQIGSPYSAIRAGDWKLIYQYATASWELYDLARDIGESHNLLGASRDRAIPLSRTLVTGLETLDANYPRKVDTLEELPPVPLDRRPARR